MDQSLAGQSVNQSSSWTFSKLAAWWVIRQLDSMDSVHVCCVVLCCVVLCCVVCVCVCVCVREKVNFLATL